MSDFRRRFLRLASRYLIRIGVSASKDFLVLLAWLLSSYPGYPGRKGFRRGSTTLLVLSRDGGDEELRLGLASVPPDVAALKIDRWVLKETARQFIRVRAGHSLDLQYRSLDSLEQGSYRKQLQGVIRLLKGYFGNIVFVQFNFVYWAEREVAAVCQELSVPFLTLQKECGWTTGSAEMTRRYYAEEHSNFPASAIAVYSEPFRELLVKAGVAPASRVRVVGSARLDAAHSIRARGSPRPVGRVIYFTINPFSGLGPAVHNQEAGWVSPEQSSQPAVSDWRPLIGAVNRAVLRFALNHPQIEIVVKAKSSLADRHFKTFSEAGGGQRLPKNLQFVDSGGASSVLEEASVIVGFNTTALLEAVAAGVPAIMPLFDGCLETTQKQFVQSVWGAVETVDSADRMEARLKSLSEGGSRRLSLTRDQERALEDLLGNSDGSGSRRLSGLLREYLI